LRAAELGDIEERLRAVEQIAKQGRWRGAEHVYPEPAPPTGGTRSANGHA
jgi:hypothetical protein